VPVTPAGSHTLYLAHAYHHRDIPATGCCTTVRDYLPRTWISHMLRVTLACRFAGLSEKRITYTCLPIFGTLYDTHATATRTAIRRDNFEVLPWTPRTRKAPLHYALLRSCEYSSFLLTSMLPLLLCLYMTFYAFLLTAYQPLPAFLGSPNRTSSRITQVGSAYNLHSAIFGRMDRISDDAYADYLASPPCRFPPHLRLPPGRLARVYHHIRLTTYSAATPGSFGITDVSFTFRTSPAFLTG